MTSEVIVDVQPKDISIALLEDKRLVEFQREGREEHYSVGNIYLAKVRKIMPGLNACFVNVGHERDGFLHYLDLGLGYRSLEKYLSLLGDGKRTVSVPKAITSEELEKDGSIQNILKRDDEVLVQILKEPISTKGPRLSCEINFPGRYLILIPFTDQISVSSKIRSSQERARLKLLVQSIKPKGFGVIIRTVAEGKRAAELDAELKGLLARWDDTIAKVRKVRQEGDKRKLPRLVYEETSRAVGLLRDLYNPSFENIYVNDRAVFEDIQAYIAQIAPDQKKIVKLYEGNLPIFDNFSVTKQLKSSFGRIVTYKRGAYLVIEHTEALHVVDVNSGNRLKSEDGQEANALEVNLGAADELARQLRLRDMGGIIVVDFIDMEKAENRQTLYERMVENLKQDRARHNILPLSKFGLMQITRQRVRPAMDVTVDESCPTCGGTGKIKSSLLFTDMLQGKVQTLARKLNYKRIRLHLHPFVAAYMRQGLPSLRMKWQLQYRMAIQIIPNQSLSYLQYTFYDADGNEIDMREEKEMK
ncbi:MAG: Rne/Rng family ribonuclease [Alloprevotella sp.]|nr:Rne/Rng family ribonuclease [Alloprevotella sp.]